MQDLARIVLVIIRLSMSIVLLAAGAYSLYLGYLLMYDPWKGIDLANTEPTKIVTSFIVDVLRLNDFDFKSLRNIYFVIGGTCISTVLGIGYQALSDYAEK